MPKRRMTISISHDDRHLHQIEEVAQSIQAQLGDIGFKDYGRIWGFKYADPVKYDIDLLVRLEEHARSPARLEWNAVREFFLKPYASKVQATTPPPPPRQAKLLLRYALPRKHQEHIIGDLQEAYYTEWLAEHGPKEARRMYWWHAIRSIAPMLWTTVKRAGIIMAILGAADWLRDRLG